MPKFKDTMIMAGDFKGLVRFYEEFVGMSIVETTEHWAMLRDEKTGQSLCITNGPSVRTTSPGIEVESLEAALGELKRLGGSVHKTWELGPMKGANCYDPENNEVMVFQRSSA